MNNEHDTTKIYLIDTFNGSGYSESGIIDTVEKTFYSDAWVEATAKARREFSERYVSQIECNEEIIHEIEFGHPNSEYKWWSFTQNHDSGAIHAIDGTSIAGLMICPDLNEIVPLETKADVDAMIEDAYNNCYDEDEKADFMSEIADTGNAGIHSDQGYVILYDLN